MKKESISYNLIIKKMKVKVFVVVFVVVILACQRTDAERENSYRVKRNVPKYKSEKTKFIEKSLMKVDIHDKDLKKRGIIFSTGGSFGNPAPTAYFPKTYAANYGYSVPSVAAYDASVNIAPSFSYSTHGPAPTVLKYPGYFHYKPATTNAAPTANLLPAFAAVPSQYHLHAGPAVLPETAATPFILRHGGAVVSSYSFNHPQLLRKPAIAVQPQTFSEAQLPPQLQKLHPVHQYFPTTVVQQPQPQLAIPVISSVSDGPQIFPNFDIPTSIPTIPTIPTPPTLPPPSAVNPIFPIDFQPPRPQQTPAFINFQHQPAAISPQFPDVFPSPASSTPALPADSGSANASPQIPAVAETPVFEQPQPTQQPWKPVFYNPKPAIIPAIGGFNRPSLTLQPPYGSSPAEAYLPPAVSSQLQQQQQQQQQRQQQQQDQKQHYQINGNIFDNLTDDEIAQVFSEANLAVQQHYQKQQQQHNGHSYFHSHVRDYNHF